MKKVELVANKSAIEQYFDQWHFSASAWHKEGILSADFPVDPGKCSSKLGQWLAENVATTRRDDDGSRVRLLMPVTEAGARLSHTARHHALSITDQNDLQRRIATIRYELDMLERTVAMYGSSLFDYRVESFEWPVFGSRDGGWHDGVQTVEEFFDFCARRIRKMGSVVLYAGLDRAAPPDTLWDAYRMRLLQSYREKKWQKMENAS
ncbi:hypothetical protein HAQ00_00710 [Acidithiobacillus caldus ATCC 51756]|uniref:hypothetical protein n=1 Tax=Acidithiobacillus caldus TaxID=33059 RepID=UPI001C07B2A7|nr:hypothetical protein [Acidithiobacillus caldus]MBU2734274.1 hypothetical protein [Acidithiobacillus caldus ATCC 51756]MBU2801744.1 hypothetical protein [Acidithiobacillus caldus]